MERCYQGLVACTLSDADTWADVHRKALWMPVFVVLSPMALFFFLFQQYIPDLTQAGALGFAVGFCVTGVGVLVPLVRRTLPVSFVSCVVCLTAVSLLAIDLGNAAEMVSFRSWVLVLLIMDILLALDVSPGSLRFILHLTGLWIAVLCLEDAFRLGLYDIEGFSKRDGEVDRACGCVTPPCSRGLRALSWVLPSLTVLYGDLFATRSFAEGLRREQAMMVASIDAIEQVTAALVAFDLQAAEGALRQAEADLPCPLQDSFARLLANLACYRPYLPQSCFAAAEDASTDTTSVASLVEVESPLPSIVTGTSGSVPPQPLQRPESADVWREPPVDRVHFSGLSAGPLLASPSTAAPLSAHAAPSSGLTLTESRSPGQPGMPRQLSAVFNLANITRSFRIRRSSGLSAGSPQRANTGDRPPTAARSDASPVRRSVHAPQFRRVTLLMSNRCGFLSAPQFSPEAASAWLAEAVGRFEELVRDQGGVTDLLSGDHLSASFGAVKGQGGHREAAARVATALSNPAGEAASGLSALAHTAAVCSGRALCGDFGSSTCQRFMAIGGVSSFVAAVERVAAAWGLGPLLDPEVHGDAELRWLCRLRGRVLFPKVSEQPLGLWEVLGRRVDGKTDEWMYELQNAEANPWDGYNAAVMTWGLSGPQGALVAVAKALDRQPSSGSHEEGAAGDALRVLRQLLQEGAPAPLADLSPHSFAGEPVPVASQGRGNSAPGSVQLTPPALSHSDR